GRQPHGWRSKRSAGVPPGYAQPFGRQALASRGLRRQEPGEERVQHPLVGIHGPHPGGEVGPALAVGLLEEAALDAGALVEEGDALVLVGELVELPEEELPGALVGGGVDGVEGDDVAVVAVGEDRALVLADVVGAAGHVAAEAGLLEVLVGKDEVVAQDLEPE